MKSNSPWTEKKIHLQFYSIYTGPLGDFQKAGCEFRYFAEWGENRKKILVLGPKLGV